MGRYSGWGWKSELDGLIFLDAASLNSLGYLIGHVSGTLVWTNSWGEKSSIGIEVYTEVSDGFTRVYYTNTSFDGVVSKCDYKIYMEATPCNFGGVRWWLECPLLRNGQYKCGRRVRRLYKSGKYFGCRQCHNLCYSEQNENKRYRSGFCRVIADSNKADELLGTIKRQYYNGRPTRKMRRYLNLERSANEVANAWLKVGGM